MLEFCIDALTVESLSMLPVQYLHARSTERRRNPDSVGSNAEVDDVQLVALVDASQECVCNFSGFQEANGVCLKLFLHLPESNGKGLPLKAFQRAEDQGRVGAGKMV